MTDEESALAYRMVEALESINRQLRGIKTTLSADTLENIVFDLDGETVTVQRNEVREWLRSRNGG